MVPKKLKSGSDSGKKVIKKITIGLKKEIIDKRAGSVRVSDLATQSP